LRLSANDYYGTAIYNLTFDSADTRYVSVVKVLPDADGVFDEVEEMLHATGFQVTLYDGPASGWTPYWDESSVAKFPLFP
jgi:hypothetical protein